jgi:predicted DNA-binding protein with PD1-like motif
MFSVLSANADYSFTECMKIVLQDANNFVLRFDKDEEVVAGLTTFMKDQAISACVFTGIGACSLVELAFYNPHVKEYRKKPYFEELEIVSFTGTGALKDGQPIVHAHGQFGRNDFTVLGGHVFSLKVSVTCELSLTKLNGQMQRTNNSDFNLNLLS